MESNTNSKNTEKHPKIINKKVIYQQKEISLNINLKTNLLKSNYVS